ncbi:MAG: hypothetical protein IJ562_09715 [Prevotella sp.]|nr:hypothetical protein [Prevotella sp.]
MTIFFILFLLAFGTLSASAQGEEPWRNNGHIELGFSQDAWNMEIGYARMFTPYMGVGASVLMDNEYNGKSLVDYLMESYTDESDYDPDDIMRFSLIPSLILRTPVLPLSKRTDRGDGVLLQVEPALMFSVPVNESEDVPDADFIAQIPAQKDGFHVYTVPTVRVKNTGGKWFYWRMKASLGYKQGAGFFYVAYSLSDYSVYDSRRNIRLNGKPVHNFPKRKFCGTVSVGVSLSF